MSGQLLAETCTAFHINARRICLLLGWLTINLDDLFWILSIQIILGIIFPTFYPSGSLPHFECFTVTQTPSETQGAPAAPLASADERATLTSRTIPTMTLSTASNPLTAPLPRHQASPAARASTRFSVQGNAIITGGAGTLALTAARALLEHGLVGLTLLGLRAFCECVSKSVQKSRRRQPCRVVSLRTGCCTSHD